MRHRVRKSILARLTSIDVQRICVTREFSKATHDLRVECEALGENLPGVECGTHSLGSSLLLDHQPRDLEGNHVHDLLGGNRDAKLLFNGHHEA